MRLSIGIVGLPNVGKSTTLNALTKEQIAQVANYPFCTIQPNKAIVPLSDPRVDKLAELSGVANRIYATIEFVDIAGLVKGASQGEGLGNQFLGQIRDTHAIVHVVRCFEDPNVIHVSEHPEPRQDIETVQIELMLADLEQLERKIERLTRQVKGDRTSGSHAGDRREIESSPGSAPTDRHFPGPGGRGLPQPGAGDALPERQTGDLRRQR